MPDMGAGTRLFHKSLATASFTFTPLPGTSVIIRRIQLIDVSASDTWVMTTGGQEVGRFYEIASGKQNLLSAKGTDFPNNNNVFDFMKMFNGPNLTYSVREKESFTLASVGGATADIFIEYEEGDPGYASSAPINSRTGNTFIAPVYFSLAASVTADGEHVIDTEKTLSFTPTLFLGTAFPDGWQASILALFLQGLGRNTYNGSADHQSVTDHVAAIRGGQRLFTEDATDGIPLQGAASAAGSANTVLGSRLTPFPEFQMVDYADYANLDSPLVYRVGQVWKWFLATLGSYTGGADYSTAIQLALVQFQKVS